MNEPDEKTFQAGQLAIARIHRRRAKSFRALAQKWLNGPEFSFVVRAQRRKRAVHYRKLAEQEIAAAKELEHRAGKP